jgi:hypothetical protein
MGPFTGEQSNFAAQQMDGKGTAKCEHAVALKMNDDQSNSSSSYTLGQMKELLEKMHGSPHLAQIYGSYEIKE